LQEAQEVELVQTIIKEQLKVEQEIHHHLHHHKEMLVVKMVGLMVEQAVAVLLHLEPLDLQVLLHQLLQKESLAELEHLII
jgi:hypothetical protein